jgi:hypothetical protein
MYTQDKNLDKKCELHHAGIHKHQDCDLVHHHTIIEEIFCHLPYAILSVAIALIFLSFVTTGQEFGKSILAYRLFHNFHFLHILFAATGTVLVFRRYSDNKILALGVGFLVPSFFCTLSDAFLPYIGGKYINLAMKFHWCFIQHLDAILPFLFAGIFNGWIMSSHPYSRRMFYSLGFHFAHIFISSMASVLYLISFGFYEWWEQIGFVFIYIVCATLIPCTLSDIVVPMFFATIKCSKPKGVKNNHETH